MVERDPAPPTAAAKLRQLQSSLPRWDADQLFHEFGDVQHENFVLYVRACAEQPHGHRILDELLRALSRPDVLDSVRMDVVNKLLLQLVRPEAMMGWMSLIMFLPPRETGLESLARAGAVMDRLLTLTPMQAVMLPLDAFLEKAEGALVGALPPVVGSASHAHALQVRELSDGIRRRRTHLVERMREREAHAAVELAADGGRRRMHDGRASASTDAELLALPSFRGIPVLPQREDVLPEGQDGTEGRGAGEAAPDAEALGAARFAGLPALPVNRARGRFPSLETYLGTHFRLMREDCLAELRGGMQVVRAGLNPRDQNVQVRMYRAVRCVQMVVNSRGGGLMWRLKFSEARPHGRRGGGGGRQGGNPRSAEQWAACKQLMTGSLLCLVDVDDPSWRRMAFATVADRNVRWLGHPAGPFIDVSIAEETLPVHFGVESDEEEDARPWPAAAAARRPLVEFDPSRTYVMFESTAYFGAYRPVLEALQSIPDDPLRLPFCDVLLGIDTRVDPPAYLLVPPRAGAAQLVAAGPGRYRGGLVARPAAAAAAAAGPPPAWRRGYLDLSASFPRLVEDAGVKGFDVLAEPWPTFRHDLNASQLAAVKLALTRRLAIVVGPPGCGKTFVGELIVRTLLHNQAAMSGGGNNCPILFVCYTNHALDSLLERLLPYERQIVRVGGQSRNEALEGYSIREWRKRCRDERVPIVDRGWGDRYGQALREREVAEEDLDDALAAATAGIHADSLDLLARHVPWAYRQIVSLKERATLVTELTRPLATATPAGAASGSDDDAEFTVAMGRAARRAATKQRFADVVARWLHTPLQRVVQQAAGVDDSDTSSDDSRSVGDAQAVAADEAERRVHMDMPVDEDERQPRDVFNVHAMQAALQAAADQNAALAPAAVVLRAGSGRAGAAPPVVDDEGRFSDEDVNGGGPARVLRRRGQQPMSQAQLTDVTDVWSLSLRNRRELADSWLRSLRASGELSVKDARAALQEAAAAVTALDEERDAAILRRAHIIGFTTTGAAKNRKLIERVKPTVLVCEEAAEVLEGHMLAALVPSIQHAVLIGDHHQLRPKVETYALETRVSATRVNTRAGD